MHHGEDMSAWHMITGPHAIWWILGVVAVTVVVFLVLKKNKGEQ